MKPEDILKQMIGAAAYGQQTAKPKPEIQKVYPPIKEFMQRTASDWMRRGFPPESHDYTFKNSAGRRCRVKFEVEIL